MKKYYTVNTEFGTMVREKSKLTPEELKTAKYIGEFKTFSEAFHSQFALMTSCHKEV